MPHAIRTLLARSLLPVALLLGALVLLALSMLRSSAVPVAYAQDVVLTDCSPGDFRRFTLEGTTLDENTAYGDGGAVWSKGGMRVSDTSFANNSTINGNGGALAALDGRIEVVRATFAANVARADANISKTLTSLAQGGAIAVWRNASARMSNSTFDDNRARGSTAIATLLGNTSATLTNVTVAGPAPILSGTFRLGNSIVATTGSGLTCLGTISAQNPNLEFPGTSCGASIQGNPLLAALSDNGGPTLARALQSGSPAIDAGDNAVCAALPVNGIDQRLVARPAGRACDLGAYEAENDGNAGYPPAGNTLAISDALPYRHNALNRYTGRVAT